MTTQVAIGLAAVSQSLTALALGFTAPSNLLRPAVAMIVFVLTWLFNEAIQEGLHSRLHVALLSAGMWIQCMRTFDDLCLTQLSFNPESANQVVGGRAKKTPTNGPRETHGAESRRRLLFGLCNLWNTRGIGTSAEISQISRWSRQDPKFVPTRGQELKRHARSVILSYLVLDVFANQPPPDLENMMSPRNERLFSRVAEISGEEAVFRFFATFGFWLNTFCVIQLMNSTIALFYLSLNIYPVVLLPPIWGNLSDSYSIRRFWGNTWHQTIRRPLVSVSEFLAHKLLRLRKKTLLARYCKLFLCFYISGALHFAADLSLGMAAGESNVITYFVTTAFVIMCEDVVQHIFRQVAGRENKKWPKFFGYVWVCCYMYWMTPSWGYPAARVVQPKDQLVSFSLVRELVKLG